MIQWAYEQSNAIDPCSNKTINVSGTSPANAHAFVGRLAPVGEIVITDITGKKVETLLINREEGDQLWDTRQLAKGVYLYTLKSGGFSETGKIVISR